MTTRPAAQIGAETTGWSLPTSFGVVVAAQVVLFAGSNLPTPLFPIYEHRYGFGSGIVTLLFSSYIAVLIPALVVLGPVADRIGRRPLLVAGMALTIVSSAAFVAADSVGWLFAGEIIYGVASALVMSCVSIAIRELHPRRNLATASLAASVAMAAGMVLGPLTSGLLAELTAWPTTCPFVLDIVLASLLACALARVPETRPGAGPTERSGRVLHVPNDIRAAFVGPAAMGAATFMFVGWVFGLSPSFFHDELNVHVTRPLASGLFAALVAFATGASQLALRHRIGRRPAAQALTAVVVGMAMIAASSISGYLPLAILGGIVAGLGAGLAQLNAMAAIQRIAPLHARSSVMSTYVTLCYVALCLPVIIAGQAADRFGLATVTTGYAGVPVRLSSSRCGSHERDRWPRSREETVVLRQSSEPESADSRRARSRHHRRCVAHPDDEAYLSAGLMAAAVDAGNHVVCVTATRGERGTSDPTRWPPSRLVDVRERELQASLASVGVDDHIWLPYFDGSCDTADPFVATKMIVTVLDDVGADTVVTFGPDGMTDHPDHIAVGKWATWAARGARRPPRVLSATKTTGWRDKYAVLHSRTPVFGPDGPPAVESVQLALALELRGPALDRKIAALTAHASQTAGLVRLMGAATYRAWAADEYFAHAAQAGCR